MHTEQSTTYRSKHEITADILGLLAVGPLNKTRVMYMAFLSAKQTYVYIAMLTENKLAIMKDDKLHLTQAGKDWLQTFKELSKLKMGAAK